MEKNSTIQHNLLPLKAFYEKLTMQEQQELNSLSSSVLNEEMQLLEILTEMKKVKRNPSATSVDIILQYSKHQSKKDPVF